MRIIKGIIITLTSLLLLVGCKDTPKAEDDVGFCAVVNSVDESEIEVTVTSDDGVHFGTYRVLTTNKTVYDSTYGETVARDSIEQGDVIEVIYNGQVMRSFPPQVVATKIIIVAKSK